MWMLPMLGSVGSSAEQIKERCKPRLHAGNPAKASWCEYFAQDNQGFNKNKFAPIVKNGQLCSVAWISILT